MIWQNSVLSEVNSDFVSNPFPVLGETVRVSLRLAADAPVERVFLRTVLAGESRLKPLFRGPVDRGYAWYSLDLGISQKRVGWHFVLETVDGDYFMYNRGGVCRYSPANDFDFTIIAGLDCPHWVRNAVFYQIFPDRFHCASPEDAVAEGEYSYDGWPSRRMDWDAPPLSWGEVHCLDFYGGDLDGIEAKISYLKELGVTAVFLNPIFTAPSVHRYDCTDYFHVDPHLGGDAALASLSSALHAAGMKIIVDVSINHTGIEHKWMGAARSDASSFERGFYYFDENGRPAGWEGVATLPQLNYGSSALRRVIWEDEDSLVRHWLKAPYNIDGWRFDVGNFTGRRGAEDYNREVFTSIRRRIKDLSREAYILAENWIDSLEYLDGQSWDAAMNYQCAARPIRRFLGARDRFTDTEEKLDCPVPPLEGQEFAAALTHYYARIPSQLAFVQFNLLDSHDIYRLHTFTKVVSADTLRGALIMLYLLPGAPSIFYGDEVGIDGDMSTNEGCRYPMPWDESRWDTGRLELYRTLNRLKREETALHDGPLRFLHTESDMIIAARIGRERSVIGVFSRGVSERTIHLDISPVSLAPCILTDVFDGTHIHASGGTAVVTLPPCANTVYVVSDSEIV